MEVIEAYKQLMDVFARDIRPTDDYSDRFYSLMSFCTGLMVMSDVNQKELNALLKKVYKAHEVDSLKVKGVNKHS